MIRTSSRRLAALLLLSAAAIAPAHAETLADAIADAYRNNPRLEAQRAELRAIDEGVIQAGSPYRLEVSLVGSLTYDQRRERDRNLFSSTRGSFITLRGKTMGVALTANQIISNGGRTAAQLSAAEADVLSGRERLREVENFILLEVVDAYASVRRDAELVDIQQRSVSSYERQAKQAREREKGGDLTRTDIAQAEAQLLIVRTQLAQARANLEQSRARFTAVVGRAPGALEDEPTLPGLPESIDAAYKIADAESPTLWQSILSERAARSRIAAERAERNPTVAVEGRYGYTNQQSYIFRDLGRALSGLVSVNVPLIQQGQTGSRIREAIARQQQSEFLVEDSRRTVGQGVLNAWNQAIASQEQLVSGQSAVTAAQSALTGVRKGFSEGFRSNFEVLDSEQRLLNAQVIVANARYNYYVSQANMLAYLGRLQAAAVLTSVDPYDAAANLERRKSQQISPFRPIVATIDALQKPSSKSPDAPRLTAPAGPAGVAPAAVAPATGDLATGFPVNQPLPADGTQPAGPK
jgi:outer membrane protein